MNSSDYWPYALAGLVGAGPALVAWATFWMGWGSVKADATSAKDKCEILSAQISLMENHFAEYKVSVAEKYATAKDLLEAETRTQSSIESLRQELRAFSGQVMAALVPPVSRKR